MKIKFLKLYKRTEEGDIFGQAIIEYIKMPYALKSMQTTDLQYQEIVESYEHFLRINLWFIILEFRRIK